MQASCIPLWSEINDTSSPSQCSSVLYDIKDMRSWRIYLNEVYRTRYFYFRGGGFSRGDGNMSDYITAFTPYSEWNLCGDATCIDLHAESNISISSTCSSESWEQKLRHYETFIARFSLETLVRMESPQQDCPVPSQSDTVQAMSDIQR